MSGAVRTQGYTPSLACLPQAHAKAPAPHSFCLVARDPEQATPPPPPLCRLQVYDADVFAPARFFLLRRQRPTNATSPLGAPGDALAWSLPADTSGLRDAASLLTRAETMYSYTVLYSFLQSLVLALLVVRWLQLLSFQPRLSLIARSLAAAMPDLLHLAAVASLVALMYAAAAGAGFGESVGLLSTWPGAATFGLQFLFLTDSQGVLQVGMQVKLRYEGGAPWLLQPQLRNQPILNNYKRQAPMLSLPPFTGDPRRRCAADAASAAAGGHAGRAGPADGALRASALRARRAHPALPPHPPRGQPPAWRARGAHSPASRARPPLPRHVILPHHPPPPSS